MNPPIDSAFDLQNALPLLEASAQAYDPFPLRGASVIASRATDTRALVLTGPEDGVIAFRGTAHLRNWLTDLECDLKPWRSPQARVHAGFLAAWRSVRHDVIDAVENFGQNRRIWITGHSLGGALAMLAALDLKLEVFNAAQIAGCYTFGQPRAGNAAFRAWFDAVLRERTFRVVHSDDIVARVPWLLGSYRHAGHEVFFPPQPASHYRLDPPWWRKAPSDVAGLARAWSCGRDALLRDHYVRAYMNLLARAPAGLPQPSTSIAQG
jgi:triacylglycerol lipase